MRINHRYDARARLSTVTATDLERRYAFAPINTALGNLVQIAESALPDIPFEGFDPNRLLARFDITADVPPFAKLIVDFSGLFTERVTLSLTGPNVTPVTGGFAVTGSGTIDLLLSDQSQNVHPDPAPVAPVAVSYQIDGIRVYQQIETINANVKFTQVLNREHRFAQPLQFNRNITDYHDNP